MSLNVDEYRVMRERLEADFQQQGLNDYQKKKLQMLINGFIDLERQGQGLQSRGGLRRDQLFFHSLINIH